MVNGIDGRPRLDVKRIEIGSVIRTCILVGSLSLIFLASPVTTEAVNTQNTLDDYYIVFDDFLNSVKNIGEYTGEPVCPYVKLVDRNDPNHTLHEDFYTISYLNNINAGTGTVVCTGKNGYTGSLSVDFEISPTSFAVEKFGGKTINGSVRPLILLDRVYTGKYIKPSVLVTPNIRDTNKILKEDVDYTLTYKNNRKMGMATVVVKGKGNYRGSDYLSFRITPDRVKIKKIKVKRVGRQTGMTLKVKKSKSKPSVYQFQLAKDPSFKKVVKTRTTSYKKIKKRKFTLKYKIKLKKGKRYYLRVRTLKKIKMKEYNDLYGQWIAGKWSKAVIIKGK